MAGVRYLDSEGVLYLCTKIKNLDRNKLSYQAKTIEEWNLNRTQIAYKNVLYIYTNFKTIQRNNEQIAIPGIKIGDGKTYLIDMPFLNDHTQFENMLLDHINDKVIHISPEERAFWNNKLNLNLQEQNLILNRN